MAFKMKQNEDYKILAETNQLVLGHYYEYVSLTIKATNEKVDLGYIYGNPNCGLIGKTNEWCIACGATLLVWTKGEIVEIEDKYLVWIEAARSKSESKVELLTDPWAAHSAIWEFDVFARTKTKIRDFTDYLDKEYTENVVW